MESDGVMSPLTICIASFLMFQCNVTMCNLRLYIDFPFKFKPDKTIYKIDTVHVA